MPAPVRNADAEYLTVKMTMERLNLCRASTIKIAKEADALLRYGNAQRINWKKLSEHFMKNYTEKDRT